MVALRSGLGNARSSAVLRDVEVPDRVPRLAKNRLFHHPGYELLRSIVREETPAGGALDEESGLVLVAAGIEAAAERQDCSERTLRRRLEANEQTARDLVRRIRLRMIEAGLANQVPISLFSKWLGYASPHACRRYIRREFGLSVKELRDRVRNCTVFVEYEP